MPISPNLNGTALVQLLKISIIRSYQKEDVDQRIFKKINLRLHSLCCSG